jgi:GWxTD domain-containing protein
MKLMALILATFCLLSCNDFAPRSEPAVNGQDDFFDQVKLIMSKAEIEIYSHLAVATDRGEFIADFWKKRDPSPESEENEFKEEFEKRVEFANRWFYEQGLADSGWDSERGRILLILGMPDRREQMPMLDNPRVKAAEIWFYDKYSLRLEFLDTEGVGKFRLDHWPFELLDATEQAKELGESAGKKNYFRFKVSRDASGLLIEMPVQYIMVEERGDDIRAAFTVTVDAYCDYVKLERLTQEREFVESRAAFMARKKIVIAVPYVFRNPGKYFLDVIVAELVTGQRYREIARFRQPGKN